MTHCSDNVVITITGYHWMYWPEYRQVQVNWDYNVECPGTCPPKGPVDGPLMDWICDGAVPEGSVTGWSYSLDNQYNGSLTPSQRQWLNNCIADGSRSMSECLSMVGLDLDDILYPPDPADWDPRKFLERTHFCRCKYITGTGRSGETVHPDDILVFKALKERNEDAVKDMMRKSSGKEAWKFPE